jgi:hypothetical protein
LALELLKRAWNPTAVLALPVVLLKRALAPTPVTDDAVFIPSALSPSEVSLKVVLHEQAAATMLALPSATTRIVARNKQMVPVIVFDPLAACIISSLLSAS